MNTIILSQWYGRIGNNIIQILNCIIYGIENNYNRVIFPQHYIFNTTEIIFDNKIYEIKKNLETMSIDEKTTIEQNFYTMAINNRLNYDNHNIKEIFQKFIQPVITNYINYNYNTNYDLTLYFRGGDIYNKPYNNEYVQPPLNLYLDIINKENISNINLITEELNNPVALYINYLLVNKWKKNNIFIDISILINSKKIILGYSVFCIFILLLNNNIKYIYVADYIYDTFKENWKIDLKKILNKNQELIIIKLNPDYIKIGSLNLTNNNTDHMVNSCS